MRQYELTYLISDNVPESELNKVTGKVGGYIKDADGKSLKEEIWGRRKLAYPIQKLDFATYITVNFEMPSDKAKEFEHNIIMTGKIIRHLMVVKNFGKEKLILIGYLDRNLPTKDYQRSPFLKKKSVYVKELVFAVPIPAKPFSFLRKKIVYGKEKFVFLDWGWNVRGRLKSSCCPIPKGKRLRKRNCFLPFGIAIFKQLYTQIGAYESAAENETECFCTF